MIKKIKQELIKLSGKPKDEKEKEFVRHYLGTKKKYLCVKTADVVKIAKEISKKQNEYSSKEMLDLLNELFSGETIEEHMVGGKIFSLLTPENRAKIPFSGVKKWLENSHGWVECDVICQSSYTAVEVLAKWDEWKKAIEDFSKSKNIQVRRGSLVLECLSARKTDDKRVRKLAFETINKLKQEKEVLITKAVSWLLRSLVFQGKEEVKKYIIKNEKTLPRIAFRETMKKIETGRK